MFSNSKQYIKIAAALSEKRSGLCREEITRKTGLPSNGALSKMLSDMEKSGFVRVNRPFGNKKREARYQLSDYYSLFYFRFLKDNYGKDEHFWSNMNDNPARLSWSELTYEQVCRDHIRQIKSKLGISGVLTQESIWYRKDSDLGSGAQIDLVIERRDRVINLCEIKFSSNEYEIDKVCDMDLRNKVNLFRSVTKTRMTIIVTMITTYGVKKNMYSNYVGREVCMDDLFAE